MQTNAFILLGILLSSGTALASLYIPPRESPLRMRVEPMAAIVEPGEDVIVQVTYENTARVPVRVLQRTDLEGAPLRFTIRRDAYGPDESTRDREPLPGASGKRTVDWEKDFALLLPGKKLTRAFNLSRDPATGGRRHDFSKPGYYSISARYESRWGLPTAYSPELVVSVFPRTAPGTRDLQQVCQLLLDYSYRRHGIEQDVDASKPLVVVRERYFDPAPKLLMGGQPVLFLTRSEILRRGIRYAVFTHLEINPPRAHATLEYGPDMVTAEFEKKDGVWDMRVTRVVPKSR